MPRQLNEIVVVDPPPRTRRPKFNTIYPDTHNGLIFYLRDKYRIGLVASSQIIEDIFRFIDSATMRGRKGIFPIRRFGRFMRKEYKGGAPGHPSTVVMKLDRSVVTRNGTVYTKEHDEEWVPDEEE